MRGIVGWSQLRIVALCICSICVGTRFGQYVRAWYVRGAGRCHGQVYVWRPVCGRLCLDWLGGRCRRTVAWTGGKWGLCFLNGSTSEWWIESEGGWGACDGLENFLSFHGCSLTSPRTSAVRRLSLAYFNWSSSCSLSSRASAWLKIGLETP